MSGQMAYVGRASCGCLRMAVVDAPAHKRDTAREIAKAVRNGETVERLPIETVREMPWRCAAHPTEKAFQGARKAAKEAAS